MIKVLYRWSPNRQENKNILYLFIANNESHVNKVEVIPDLSDYDNV